MRPLLATVLVAAPFALVAQQPSTDLYGGMRWRLIGPYRSGYITSVAGIPGNPYIYYVGTPEGGVWKTTNGGNTWQPIFDSIHVASIGAVAVSASDHNVVYVGTGNQSGWSFTGGNGVYKSIDAGKTWTNIGLPGTRYISAIMVDPANANIALVAALGAGAADTTAANERGVYRTTDGGRTWARVLPSDGSAGASEMVYDYYDPKVIYVTLQRGGGGRGGAAPAAAPPAAPPAGIDVYKSVDGGVTWKPVGTQGLPVGTRTFAPAVASGTHGRRVYAEVRGGGRGAGGANANGLYRSDDGGDTWTLGTRAIASAAGHIYADPQNPDIVYLMGTSMYRSVDGGHRFDSFMGAPSGDDIRNLWIDPTNGQRMLAGADQGPTISVDGGATWAGWYNLPDGQYYRVSTDNQFPYHVCGPQQDSGTACVQNRSDFGEIRANDWAPVGGFENGFIATDPTDPRWVYTQGWYHVLRRFDRKTGQVVVLYNPTPADRFGGGPPLMFSPQNPHVLYMAAQYLMASSDSGQSWRKISPDLTSAPGAAPAAGGRGGRGGRGGVAGGGTGFIQALAPSAQTPGEIWAGTSTGLIQLTRDNGVTWTNVTPKDMPAGAVNVVDASRTTPGTAFAAIMGRAGENHPYILRTTNYGKTWDRIVNDLPDGALVRVVRQDPRDPNLVYAGTVTSAWVSFDKGDHWQSLQLNLPTTTITDMTIHGSDLVISTYGRAFWILDDVTPLRQIRAAMAASGPAYLFRPDTALRVQWDNTEDTPQPPDVPAGRNPPEGAIIDYYLKAPVSGGITLTFSDLAGHVIRRYSDIAAPSDTMMPNVPEFWFKAPVALPTSAGMHRIAWDLRYPDPETLPYGYNGGLLNYTEYTLNWHSIVGETPREQPTGPTVVPGTYRVTLSAGGQSESQTVVVRNDPRIAVTQTALVTQFAFQQRMTAGMNVSYDGFMHIEHVLAQAADAVARSAAKAQAAEISAAAQALEAALGPLATSATAPAGMGPANRDLARHLADMEFGDVLPTANIVAATDIVCRSLDAAIASFVKVQSERVAPFNALLAQAQLAPVALWTPPAGPACGGATAPPAR